MILEKLMAVKKVAGKKSAKRDAETQKPMSSALDRIIDAGLEEVSLSGWRNTTLGAIASRAGVDLGEALSLVPTKAHFVLRLLDRLDALTTDDVRNLEGDSSARDRLFEILMRRFDALNEHRDGARSVITGVMCDPWAASLVVYRLHCSLSVMLTVAGVSPDGFRGALRIKGLAAVGAYALRAWIKDDSSDLAKTMAALDRALAQAERLARFSLFGSREQTGDAAI